MNYLKFSLRLFICTGWLLSITYFDLKAQTTQPTQYFLPALAPRSPSAGSLEKYGTYQVNEFTGVPDISIPLYTIEAGGFKIPITLSYHASGIKVTDVASWAGLGWSVSTGGQISRKTNGLPDDMQTGSPENPHYGYLWMGHWVPTNASSATLAGLDSLEWVANGGIDLKPDIYSYDFPGHSGKFFFDGATSNSFVPRLLPYAPLKINYTLTPFQAPPGFGGLTNFTITDEHGNIYKYGDVNATEITSSSSGGSGVSTTGASAWKIESMISQNRRDTVNFSYTSDSGDPQVADSEIFTVIDNVQNNGYAGASPYSATYTSTPTTPGNICSVSERLVQQINFKNGKVVFDLDSLARTDHAGAYGLKDIKVYLYNYGTKTMELQKTVKFYKSYFAPVTSARLRLDSIQVLDKASSIVQHYRFDYNTAIKLPFYGSMAMDYWGYYNGCDSNRGGKTINTMLTPQQTIIWNNGSPQNVTIGSANRNCDSNYMQAFMLTGIHYPTGGYSTFAYQTNQYYVDGVLYTAGGLRIKTISSYDGVSPTPIVKTYVYNKARANFAYGITNGFYISSYFVNTMTHRYYAATGQQGLEHVLAATEQVRTFTNTPHCDIEAYDGAIVVYQNVSEYIGTPGNNIGRTDYAFTDINDQVQDASAAGQVVPLSYFYARGQLIGKREFINKGGGVYQIAKMTTNSYTAFQVTQYENAGYTVQKLYYNEGSVGNPIPPGGAIPDDSYTYNVWPYEIQCDDNYLTGTVVNTYDANDTTKYTMSTIGNSYDNIVHQQVTRTYHTDSKGNTLVTRMKYPADYPSSNAVIDTMVNRNMQAELIEKYDTLKNAATSVNAIISGQLNKYMYNGNILPSTISTLSVAQPLTNFTISNVSSGTLTSDSRYVQMISFDQYDTHNNILQYTPRNSTPVSILWDYLGENPVAQVKNATTSSTGYTQVCYTSFEADGKGNWLFSGAPLFDPTTPTGTMVYPLSGGSISSPSTLATGTTYVLSYWSNGGAATVYAGSYLTGTALRTFGAWTYYEYQVPASTAISISGTTSIDDLRLYPSAAQMTTYAYDPSGLRSIEDTKGSVNYFEYDYFSRLKNVKDWNGNIVKNYGYHTYDQTIGNDAIGTTVFTRNNCPAGTSPQSTTYSVPANRYFSSTKASANAEATYDLDYNGQTMANNPNICGCPISYITFTIHNSTTTSFTLTFTGVAPYSVPTGTSTIGVPAATYSTLTVSANDSNTHNITLGSRGTQYSVHNYTFNTVVIATGSSDLTLTLQ